MTRWDLTVSTCSTPDREAAQNGMYLAVHAAWRFDDIPVALAEDAYAALQALAIWDDTLEAGLWPAPTRAAGPLHPERAPERLPASALAPWLAERLVEAATGKIEVAEGGLRNIDLRTLLGDIPNWPSAACEISNWAAEAREAQREAHTLLRLARNWAARAAAERHFTCAGCGHTCAQEYSCRGCGASHCEECHDPAGCRRCQTDFSHCFGSFGFRR